MRGLEVADVERERAAVDDAGRVDEANALELRRVHLYEHQALRATSRHVVAHDRVAELHRLVRAHEHVENVFAELHAVAHDELVARMLRRVEPVQRRDAVRVARAAYRHEGRLEPEEHRAFQDGDRRLQRHNHFEATRIVDEPQLMLQPLRLAESTQ